MRRRDWLASIAMAGIPLRSQQGQGMVVFRRVENSVPIADGNGKIAYRFRSYCAVADVDIGGGQKLQLVAVPGGRGMMGAERQWRQFPPWSTPVHPVQINGFLLGRFEVTQAQWLEAAKMPRVNRDLTVGFIRPRNAEEEQYPVEISVSHFVAQEFCDRIAAYTGLRFRLPSEAEWEYACRAGTETWWHFGDSWGSVTGGSEVLEWERFRPVGFKNVPNRFGLHGMHGGVGEWCADWVHPDYTNAPVDGSAWMSSRGNSEQRIVRGGYTLIGEGSAGRTSFVAGGFTSELGLRVAASYAHGTQDPRMGAAVHAALLESGEVAPGQMLTLYGENIGPESLAVSAGHPRMGEELSGVEVWFDDLRAPVWYVSRGQAGVMVPFGLEVGKTVRMVLCNGFQSAAPVELRVGDANPGVFTRDGSGRGLVAALVDGSRIHGPEVPARRGGVVTVYGTGFGRMNPALPDGAIGGAELARVVGSVRVWVGGVEAVVEYAGQAPGFVAGIVQLNFRLGGETPTGEQGIVVDVGGRRSLQAVTLFVA